MSRMGHTQHVKGRIKLRRQMKRRLIEQHLGLFSAAVSQDTSPKGFCCNQQANRFVQIARNLIGYSPKSGNFDIFNSFKRITQHG